MLEARGPASWVARGTSRATRTSKSRRKVVINFGPTVSLKELLGLHQTNESVLKGSLVLGPRLRKGQKCQSVGQQLGLLLVAVRMERLKDGRLEFVAHFLRSLAQDVLEAVLLATLLEASREDLCDRFEHSRIPVRHDEQRLPHSSGHHLLQEPLPVLVGFSVADTDMKKISRPISAIAGSNEDGRFPLRSLVVAQVRAVELEIQQLLVREIPFSKRLEILRQTPCDPAHHRLRDTRAAQHVRERRLNVTRRHPVDVHPRDQFIEFLGPAHVGVENL